MTATGHGGGARRPRVVDLALELALVSLGLAVIVHVLLRGLWPLPLGRELLLVGLWSLLAFRVWRGTRADARSGWSPGRWLAGCRTPTLVLAAGFVLALALLPTSGSSLGSDGEKYLEQLADVWLSGRLTSHLGIEPGVSILQAPFFFLGHGAALAASALGTGVAADGTAAPYRNALRLGGVVYGLLAAALAWVVCRRFFPPLFSAVCAGGAWLSSTLFHYSVVEPGMAHAPAAALASLLLVLWLRARDEPRAVGRWAAVAFAGGFLVATQRYDAYLLLPATLTGVGVLRGRWTTGDAATRRRTLLALALVVGAFALAVLPLLLLSLAPSGFLLDPETTRPAMLGHWRHPHVGEVLFSSNRGLFAWTPIALLGVLGLVAFARRERRVGVALLSTLALGVLVLSSNPIWWAGWSFGARRLTEAFAIFALGFCALAAAAIRRPRALGLAALGGLVVANVSLSDQYRRGALAPRDAVSFTRAMQGVVTDFYERLGHPPSWPANWLFAARYGLGPDRFDDFYGRLPRKRWETGVGAPGDREVLGRGWSPPQGEGRDRWRWALGGDSTLLFALSAPADRSLAMVVSAARRRDGRRQGLAVEVNGRAAGRFALPPESREVNLMVPAALWSEGLNEIRLVPEWALSRSEAWGTGQPAYASWSLRQVRLEPVELAGVGR